jgi:DNA primase
VSQRIPPETIQDILHRADIVEVIGDYVELKQRGGNAKGLCPFHQEKTPSFTVSSVKGLFYCFGCQASGDVIRFLMQHDGLAFLEAVRLLADRYGIPIPEAKTSPHDGSLQQLYRLHQAAVVFFAQRLKQDPEAQAVRDYCRQRLLSSEVVERFCLGYAPNAWETLGSEMQRQGFSQDLLVRSGLVVRRDHQRGVYDRFRHRLIFPICDRQGRPVAFGGRALASIEPHAGPKYLNSPETPIFQKNRTLYGFHLAKQAIRQQGRAVIVEGYTDVITCHRHGINHVVGTLGTALTEMHVEMLKGLTKDVVLLFDADTAGGKATERGIGLFLDAGLRVRIVELPEGEDPDSFLQKYKGEALLRQIEDAQTFLDYLLTRNRRYSDLHTPAGQADCVARFVPLLRKIDNEVERWGYMAQLADQLGLPSDVLQRQMGLTDMKRTPMRRALAPQRRPQPLVTPGPQEEYLLIQELCHAFQDVRLRAIFTVLVRCAPQWQDTAFPHIRQEVDDPGQVRLLDKMAMEDRLNTNAEQRTQALQDCLARMQQRHRKAQRRRVIEQLRSASGAHERELLHELQRLQHGEEVGLPV